MTSFFSERERGERPRDIEDIGAGAWGGIQALVRGRISDGSFGATFPESCVDGRGPIGTDETSFWQAMRAEIRGFEEMPWYGSTEEPPTTLDILDMIEFCWRCVGKPTRGSYHDYFGHYHLRYDIDAGREEFRDSINRILRRNGIAFELKDDGQIERIVPAALREALMRAEFQTGDSELDAMLEKARRKISDPDLSVRREALEALWDAWERAKTLDGPDKKTQASALLDVTAGPASPKLREALEREARELSWIGNNLQIRHSETNREPVSRTEHVDYLFHRLFALINAILRSRGQGGLNAR